MSTIFLAIACAREKRTKLFDAIEPLVPILPERCDEATSIHGKIELRAWTVNASLARGSRFHKDQKTGAVSSHAFF